MPELKVNLCGIEFKNPIIAASGTFGFGTCMEEYADINKLGGIALKAVTLKKRDGNPPPRIAETVSGCLNSVGLQNPGVDAFLEKELPEIRKYDTRLIANVAGETENDYIETVKRLAGCGIDMIELNVSCPNVKRGGITFGTNAKSIYVLTKKVKEVSDVPIIVKLTPNVTDIAEMAMAAEKGGADAISLINTLAGMAVDAYSMRPVLGNVTGGLSGPAIKPVALRMVYIASKAVKIPIIGMGGIMTGTDVAEFMLCGASAVMVGTANMIDPSSCGRIICELTDYLDKMGIGDVNQLVGALKV